jgi:REP element-mobilizing transposase RayT
MSRRNRIQASGTVHHVTAHGLGGIPLFRAPDDRNFFVNLIRNEVLRSTWKCLEYCVMTTHYHLVIELTDDDTLSTGVGHLNRLYATYFNSSYARRGHAFEARFDDVLVDTHDHRLEVVRYVALNPTRAAICRLPEQYPWSAYGSIIGLFPDDPTVDLAAALEPFGGSRSAYREFVEEIDPRLRRR